MSEGTQPRTVRIPRHLLHLKFDDLGELGISIRARAALRELVADLPLVPGVADCAALVGAAEKTLPCLAALARHVGQGLRDHNVGLMHDRDRLRTGRLKLAFLTITEMDSMLPEHAERLAEEAVLFLADELSGTSDGVGEVMSIREARGRATFASSGAPEGIRKRWRAVRID